MHVLIGTQPCGGETTLDLECAVVEITTALFDTIVKRSKTFEIVCAADPSLYEMLWWAERDPIRFYDDVILEDLVAAVPDAQATLNNDGQMVLPEDFDVSKYTPQRVECTQFQLHRGNIFAPEGQPVQVESSWIAIPKHCGIYVQTLPAPLRVLSPATDGS